MTSHTDTDNDTDTALPQPDQHEYNFIVGSESIVSVSDEEQITNRMNALAVTNHDDVAFFGSDNEDEDEGGDLDLDVDLEERAQETRLRYARLQARGRAAELAYNHRLQRERDDINTNSNLNERDRSRSHSKSRSRPSTPMLGALFKRDNFAISITRSKSPPVNPFPEKSSRRPSITNLFKFKPISRSSSSKSIHVSSASSSQPNSPFPSPITPLSPLPFLFSPKMRRKTMNYSGEDNIEVAALSGPNPGFGSPLTRISRRPSPTRTMTLPDDLDPDDSSSTITIGRRRRSYGTHVHSFHSNARRSRRESSPLGRPENFTTPR